MGRIVQPQVQPADLITAAKLNSDNSDYSTLINNGNVRVEGVDLVNMATVTTGEAGLILVDSRSQGNSGATQAYSSTATPSRVELAHGAGTRLTYGAGGRTLIEGDVLRAYWNVVATDFTLALEDAPYRYAAWVIYLEWDITSNALANFVAVPGQGDFDSVYTDTVNTTGSSISLTRASMLIPHGLRYYEPVGLANADIDHDHISMMRMYAYQHTGATVTIFGMRLVIRGLCYPWYTAANPVNRIVQRTSGGRDQESITIGAAQLIALIMRGD